MEQIIVLLPALIVFGLFCLALASGDIIFDLIEIFFPSFAEWRENQMENYPAYRDEEEEE